MGAGAGLTIVVACAELGVSATSVYRWKNSLAVSQLSGWRLFCDSFGCTVDWAVRGASRRPAVVAQIPRDRGAIPARRFACTRDADTLSRALAVTVRNRSDSFTAEGALLSQWTASRSVASTTEVCAVEGEELSV